MYLQSKRRNALTKWVSVGQGNCSVSWSAASQLARGLAPRYTRADMRTPAASRAVIAMLLIAAAGASVGRAQLPDRDASAADNAAIPADAAGSLPAPAEWRCDRIAPEYRSYLAGGGTVEEWRYAGRTYRTVDRSSSTYTWADWLRWYEAACGTPIGGAEPRGLGTPPDLPLIMGGVVAGVGIIGLIGSGSASDSPG